MIPLSCAAKWSRRLFVCITICLVTTSGWAADAYLDAAQLPSHPDVPDPLIMLDGTRVTTKSQWENKRRPELIALFQHYMYGTLPPAPKSIQFKVERVDKKFFGGKATKKEVAIQFSDAANGPVIQLLLVIPNAAPKSGPPGRGFPVFVGLNFCGNHTLVTDTNVALTASWYSKSCPGCVDNHATDAGRGAQADVWSLEQSIDRGYAVATFYCGDIEPDTTNSTTGLRAYLASKSGGTAVDCGAIAAWAWGLSRAADYLVMDGDIDKKRIMVVGHSRMGKAAIFAAAMDERFAMAIPLQAGCGGTAPSRGKIGESVKAINDHFPHWYNAEFKKFNDQPDRLPFDQNCMIALVAPRPVLIGVAQEDTWGNPAGVFDMMRAAEPVYQLLGVAGTGAEKMPEMNQLTGERLGFFIRPGKHSMAKGDWQVFMDYADKQLP